MGIWKTPIAAGRGGGGRSYDVVPGMPEASILMYRIESTEPGVMMPELARRLVDREGVALVREWIASMHDSRADQESLTHIAQMDGGFQHENCAPALILSSMAHLRAIEGAANRQSLPS